MEPTLFELTYYRAPAASKGSKQIVRKGRKARNLRGEVLEEKVNGTWRPRIRYTDRDVQCPHCMAAPRRKCVWAYADLPQHLIIDQRLPAGGRHATYKETQREVNRRNRRGWSHQARSDRARALSEVHGRQQLGLLARPHP